MKRKTIALALILAIVTIILTGCSSSIPKYEEENNDDKTFMAVEEYFTGRVLVDRDTNVMYWESQGTHNYGTLTLLVDQDGKPKIWNGGK